MDDFFPIIGTSDYEIQSSLQSQMDATKQAIHAHGDALASADRGGYSSLSKAADRLGHRTMGGLGLGAFGKRGRK